MKKLGTILVLLLAVQLVNAQSDAKAKEILDKVSAKTKTFKGMSADFVFSMVNDEMDIHEENAGTIKLKGQKYKVALPGTGYEIYSDGKTIWTYMKDGNQVTVTNVEEDNGESIDNPASIFSIYERGFRSKFINETQEDGKTIYHIQLFPDSDEYQVNKIDVSIDKATLMLDSATLDSTDGNLYKIVVKKMNTNADFPDTDFVFNAAKYPDVEVIDLR